MGELARRATGGFYLGMHRGNKREKKGRAKGGFLIGAKKTKFDIEREWIKKNSDKVVRAKMKLQGEDINVWSVYNKGTLLEVINMMSREIGIEEEGILVIGGNFNIRIGELGSLRGVNGSEEIKRNSKDITISNEGRDFVEIIEEKGWLILNGAVEGDWEGEYTYVGPRGSTVIDYVIANEKAWERIVNMQVGEAVESDHAPLMVKMDNNQQEAEGEREGEEEERSFVDWSEEARSVFVTATKEGFADLESEGRSEEKWNRLKAAVKGAMQTKTIKRKRRKLGHKVWWDRECTRQKRDVKRKYKKWRKGRIQKEEFWEAKMKMRDLFAQKQKKKKEEEEAELRSIKEEGDVWKFINKRRKKRKAVKNKIREEEWLRHFMELLEGTGVRTTGERRAQDQVEIEDITEEEVIKAVRKMKRKKAAGADGIPNEA